MKKGLATVLLIFMVAFSFAQSSREAKVLTRVEALNKAVFITKDSAAIQDLLGSEATYGHSDGRIENKPVMLHNAVANKSVYNNFTVEPLSIFFANKKTALVRHILRASVVDKGAESPLNLGILQTWVKQRGKWRLVGRQAVKVPAKS